ncbi:MAG: hypothetical protein MJZ12_01535 [Prevotella sp.]|nr:hypothetical protein [Prevotella sp.]
MKKLFTLFAFLSLFMGAKAIEIVDAEVKFSEVTDLNSYKYKGWFSDAAVARLSLVNGCLHFHSEEATDPSWDCQFQPIVIEAPEVDVVYTLHFKIKGSLNKNISFLGVGQTPYGEFPVTTDWVAGTVEYTCKTADGTFMIQCGDYVGDFDIEYLKVTHEGKQERPTEWIELITNGDAEKSWEELGLADTKFNDADNNAKICFWSKEKGHNMNDDGGWDPFPAEIITEANGNHAFICRAQTADTEGDAAAWDNQIWIESPRAWKTGEQFRLKFRYKASEPVVTNTQYHKQTPSDYLHWQAVGDVSFTTEWQEFEQVVTVPADANGAYSVAFNLNPKVKTPVDFYIDDISWCEMKLDHGLFITAKNTETGNVDYDSDNAIEFVYNEEMDAMAATVGTKGNQDSWVNEVMISTVRGNDRQFKANTIKAKGSVRPYDADADGPWYPGETASAAKIKLPAQGVWTVYIIESETESGKSYDMAFEELEGEKAKDPVEIVPNENEIVIETVERNMTMDEAKAAGLIADPENPTDEEKALYDGQPWDNQFFLIGNRKLEVGEEVFISFDYKSETPATVGTQNSENAGGYLHWAGLGNIEFTEEWQHFETTVTIPGETSGNQNSWTFNLANAQGANKFYIKNIIFANGDKDETFIDMVEENPDNFQKKVGANTAPVPTGIQIVVNKKNNVAPNVIFNLAGQRVSNSYKGIVIQNGVKVIK